MKTNETNPNEIQKTKGNHHYIIEALTITGLFLLTLIYGCKKDDYGTPASASTVANHSAVDNPIPMSSYISIGSWKISNYLENDVDHTRDYQAFSFQFYKDGRLVATNLDVLSPGAWNYDSRTNAFHIDFSANDFLSKLSNDWIVSSVNATELVLMDKVNGPKTAILFTRISNPDSGGQNRKGVDNI